MKRLNIFLLAASAAITLSCTGASHLQHPDWAPDVQKALNDFMDCNVRHAGQYAVFDFDNTTSIFDIEENQMLYQLLTMSFEMTPERLTEVISTDLDLASGAYDALIADISAAYSHLYGKFGPFTYKGLDEMLCKEVQSDMMWEEFASKMNCLYSSIYHRESPTVAYNWTKYWVCGMTEEQVDDLSARSNSICSSMETTAGTWRGSDNIQSQAGPMSYDYVLGVGVSDNSRELWKTLHANGIDVWVCSASGIRQVLAAVDYFGLRDYCTGVLAMTIAKDSLGRFTNAYDYEGHAYLPSSDGGWIEDSLATGAQTCGPGKVTAIQNAIAPKYGGRGPSACFMDSTGDFNFCTEFSSLQLVTCFNRGTRKVTDGGGLVGETAIYERDVLGYTFRKARKAGDIMFLLQGRDDNGLRSLRSSNATIRLGESEETLFATDENRQEYEYFKSEGLSVAEILNTFSVKTSAEDSPLGFPIGFLGEYNGYRSR